MVVLCGIDVWILKLGGQEHAEHANVRKSVFALGNGDGVVGRYCGVHRVSVGCPARSITSSNSGPPDSRKTVGSARFGPIRIQA